MRRFALLPLAGWLIAAPLIAQTPSADELFAKGVAKLAAVFDANPANPAEFRTNLEITRSEGLPKALRDLKVELAIATPDRLQISTTVDKQRLTFGRLGQELWMSLPGKNFAIVGSANVPRFKADPASVEDIELAPLGIQIDHDLIARLPRLFQVEKGERTEIDGEPCQVVIARPLPEPRESLRLPDMELKISLRERDSIPARIAYKSAGADLELALHQPRFDAPSTEEAWRLPVNADTLVERVALSHLTKFVSAAVSTLDSKTEKLGPAKGDRTLVGRTWTGPSRDP
jgi:hypothetical protein